MAYTAAQRLQIREWVGAEPDDAALDSYADDHGDPYATALSILRQRRADIVGGPSQRQWVGDYAETFGPQTLERLDRLIDEVAKLVTNSSVLDTLPGAVTVANLTRADMTTRGHTHAEA